MFPIFPRRVIVPLLFLGWAMVFSNSSIAASIGFERTGNMGHKRESHTATLLPSGKVLVTGGNDTYTESPTTELYNPASGKWEASGSMADRRSAHTATLLSNGKVLVAAGTRAATFSDLASAELYDPTTKIWTPTGNLQTKRAAHTATLLPDGKVLVCGGSSITLDYRSYTLSAAELYDPATGMWTSTGSLVTPRANHTATLLPNGKVLVAGGETGGSYSISLLSSAELYDPATGKWTQTGNLATARETHTATLLPNGKVLVAGGYYGQSLASMEMYDPESETWTPCGNLVAPRGSHTTTLLPDGKLLIVGGFPGGGASLASAELFDPATGISTSTGSLVDGRAVHTATLLSNGNVLVAGGNGGAHNGNVLPRAEIYGKPTPTLLNISTRADVQTGDKILIGGFIITGTGVKTVIVRGIGPSLPMAGALTNPVIEVYSSDGVLLGTNDNWKEAATRQEISDSGLAPTNDLESALWGKINPGAYTVVLSGKDGGSGVGAIEVYDLDAAADSRLANISTRGFVDTGDNVMIGGLIVGGGSPTGTANVVVRALGPSIPVTGALANPTLELHDGNGTAIAFNDDWKTRPDGSSQQAEIEATTIPPSNDLESALVRRLSPGNYTAIIRGNNNSTGIGLVEVYHLQ